MPNLLYPRLAEGVAGRIVRERAELPLDELAALAATSHPDAAPAATGGHPADESALESIQLEIRAVAKEAGYPTPIAKLGGQSFDRPCGTRLFREMAIVTADAAEEGVWSFLTLILVPEIGPWRFPDRAEHRLMGKPRNVLRRTWWRAWAFGGDLDVAPEGCRPLGEDEFVQIMERPSLGGNQRTARAIRDTVWRAESAGLSVARSEFVREITRRLRAIKSHTALDAMTDSEFADVLNQLAVDSNSALSGSPISFE
jgi:hypothetical protein